MEPVRSSMIESAASMRSRYLSLYTHIYIQGLENGVRDGEKGVERREGEGGRGREREGEMERRRRKGGREGGRGGRGRETKREGGMGRGRRKGGMERVRKEVKGKGGRERERKATVGDLSPHHLAKVLLLSLNVQSRLLLNLSDLLHRVLGEQSRDVRLHIPGGGAYTQAYHHNTQLVTDNLL